MPPTIWIQLTNQLNQKTKSNLWRLIQFFDVTLITVFYKNQNSKARLEECAMSQIFLFGKSSPGVNFSNNNMFIK